MIPEHPEYLICKRLADIINTLKIEHHFLESVEPCQEPFGLRTGNKIIFSY